jgi:hypothetical protein
MFWITLEIVRGLNWEFACGERRSRNARVSKKTCCHIPQGKIAEKNPVMKYWLLDLLTLEMVPSDCPETSVRNYYNPLRAQNWNFINVILTPSIPCILTKFFVVKPTYAYIYIYIITLFIYAYTFRRNYCHPHRAYTPIFRTHYTITP